MVTFTVGPRDPGTDEGAWMGWGGLDRLPPLDGRPGHVVVVAPHPDDETLGAGGLLHEARAWGARVDVVGVTDGEAAPCGPAGPRALAAERRAERDRALGLLGCPDAVRHRLGVPDGGVREREGSVAAHLARLLGPGSVCLAPWSGDGHPDHDATGRAAARAAGRTGATLWQYLVWAWHWAAAGDPVIPWSRARRLDLPAAAREAKQAAVAAFTSQTEPVALGVPAVLPPAVLRRFSRPFEVYLV